MELGLIGNGGHKIVLCENKAVVPHTRIVISYWEIVIDKSNTQMSPTIAVWQIPCQFSEMPSDKINTMSLKNCFYCATAD